MARVMEIFQLGGLGLGVPTYTARLARNVGGASSPGFAWEGLLLSFSSCSGYVDGEMSEIYVICTAPHFNEVADRIVRDY